jgi:hypothetical protein
MNLRRRSFDEAVARAAAAGSARPHLCGGAIDLETSVLRATFAGTVTARTLLKGTITEAGGPVLPSGQRWTTSPDRRLPYVSSRRVR